MLVVETIAKIRRYHFVEGRKIRQIARDLNISRNTVRKVIRGNETEHRYEREEQPLPRLGAYTDRLGLSPRGFSLRELILAIHLTHQFTVLGQRPCRLTSPAHSAAVFYDHPAFAGLQVLFSRTTTHRTSLSISLLLIGSLISVPPKSPMSPPGVTHRSSTPCHPHTPWFDGWIRMPSPP